MIQCSVPHCPRTTDRTEFPEWICAVHWKGLPAMRRRAYNRAKKRGDGEAASRLWRRLKATAIERAVGI